MTFEEQLAKRSNWGKWGADDEKGALNYITDKKRAEAAALVRRGRSFALGLPVMNCAGPQQGLVWAKASESYDKAIELDPGHWQARFGKAFGISMAPEFLGVRPVAIKQFEELLAIQEQGAPEPHHAQTYFRLGTLYKDAGNTAKAREIWDRGLRLFPDNSVLKGTIEASTKK